VKPSAYKLEKTLLSLAQRHLDAIQAYDVDMIDMSDIKESDELGVSLTSLIMSKINKSYISFSTLTLLINIDDSGLSARGADKLVEMEKLSNLLIASIEKRLNKFDKGII